MQFTRLEVVVEPWKGDPEFVAVPVNVDHIVYGEPHNERPGWTKLWLTNGTHLTIPWAPDAFLDHLNGTDVGDTARELAAAS